MNCTDNIASKVAELQSREYNTIAIICKSAAESAAAYDALSIIGEIKLVRKAQMNMNKALSLFRLIWRKVSNSMLSSFMMHLRKYTAMRAYEIVLHRLYQGYA